MNSNTSYSNSANSSNVAEEVETSTYGVENSGNTSMNAGRRSRRNNNNGGNNNSGSNNNNGMNGGRRTRNNNNNNNNNNNQEGGRRRNATRKNNTNMSGGAKIPAVGTKAQVFHGTAKHTSGGLTKKDLMKTKKGRIVSRRKHAAGKKALQRLKKAGYVAKKGTFKLFKK